MEDVIREVEGRFKVSITDSTMMWLVQQAMDKAHEKLKSSEGVITRLNEISKFYELAVMQLNGCLTFVQEETGSYILESDHEEVLLDLREIRDRLHCRLRETELAILEIDRELGEKSENEFRLKQALEMKENELVSLRVNLERTRSEGVEEFLKSNLEGTNEDRDGEIFELKNSVDQQMMNIRQRLDPEYKLDAGEEFHSRVDNKKIEKMDVDIDVLKGTLDLAFSKMHNAIFLSELGPIEQSWRWALEKDVVAVLIRGLVEDFEAEKMKLARKASVGSRDLLCDFVNEISFKRRELKDLGEENEFFKKSTGLMAKSSSVGGIYEQKIIKNQSKEPVLPKPEPFERQKRTVSSQRRKENVTASLDNLINLNTNLQRNFAVDGDETSNRACEAKRLSEFDASNAENVVRDGLDDVWAKLHNLKPASDQGEEITNMRQEKEDAELQAIILEDTYMTLLKGLISKFHTEMQGYSLRNLKTEGMNENIIEEIIKEKNERIESERIKTDIREGVYGIVISKAAKDLGFSRDASSKDCSNCLETYLKEDVNLTFFREMLKEWNKHTESYHEEDLFRQDLSWIHFKEILESSLHPLEHNQSQLIDERVTEKEINLLEPLVIPCEQLTEAIDDSENRVLERLEKTASKVENLQTQLHWLTKDVVSLRQHESVYRRAFFLRCKNLQKAETEVDLLGDQVDALLELLEKINRTLNRHQPVLQQNPEISDVSSLIKTELSGFFASPE